MNRRSFFMSMAVRAIGDESALDQRFQTKGSFNGRAWIRLEMSSKIFYVEGARSGVNAGVLRGFKLAAGIPNDSQTRKILDVCYQFVPESASIGEVRESVDLLCRDPANLQLPIIDLMQAAAMRLKGSSLTEVEKFLEFCRQTVN